MSATSSAAYNSMKGVSPSIRARMEEFIRARGDRGATREELEIGLSLKHPTVNGRMRELEKKGLIMNTMRLREQSSGRNAYVWVTPEFGPPEPLRCVGCGSKDPVKDGYCQDCMYEQDLEDYQ